MDYVYSPITNRYLYTIISIKTEIILFLDVLT